MGESLDGKVKKEFSDRMNKVQILSEDNILTGLHQVLRFWKHMSEKMW